MKEVMEDERKQLAIRRAFNEMAVDPMGKPISSTELFD